MAEYRTVRMAFWHDPFVEELDAKGKLLYLYLFTGPYTNNFGIVEVTRKKISFETGLSTQEVEKYLADLEAGKKIITDGGWIWLVNFIKNQTKTSPRIIDGLVKDAPSSVPTKKIAEAICHRYPQVYEKEMVDGDTYTIPTPLGTHTFTYTCPEFGIWNLEGEKEKGKTRTRDGKALEFSDSFLEFWEAYPSKTGKDKAYESWQKVKAKHPGISPPKIIAAIKAQIEARHFLGRDGEDYIPNPATWLNQGRWSDEITDPKSRASPVRHMIN